MSSKLDLSWAAGFFDGEGYVGVHRIKKCKAAKRINLTIAQTDKAVLIRFFKAVGVGIINGPYFHKNKKNHKKYWQYSSGNTYCNTLVVFNKLKPYLSKIKTKQFKRALKEYERYQQKTKYTKVL